MGSADDRRRQGMERPHARGEDASRRRDLPHAAAASGRIPPSRDRRISGVPWRDDSHAVARRQTRAALSAGCSHAGEENHVRAHHHLLPQGRRVHARRNGRGCHRRGKNCETHDAGRRGGGEARRRGEPRRDANLYLLDARQGRGRRLREGNGGEETACGIPEHAVKKYGNNGSIVINKGKYIFLKIQSISVELL